LNTSGIPTLFFDEKKGCIERKNIKFLEEFFI
jgi:hypothetical protein